MTKLNKFTHFLVLSFLFLCLQTTLYSQQYNINHEQKLKTYHDSGEYDQTFNQVVLNANTYIDQRVKENKQAIHPKKLAIILDIDETSLSNYDYMQQHHFVFNLQKNRQKIAKGDMPAIKSTLELFKNARKNGVSVFFITGRPKKLCPITVKNLKNVGYNNWQDLVCRNSNGKEKSVIPFKSSIRKLIIKKGYTIIANIGDQDSDIKGGFAEKTFKLPNPFYQLP